MNPRFAIVAVLDRCDAKCVMCNIWKEHQRDETSLSYFNTLPESLRSVNVTGGEPFMRQDLAEVIRIIDKRCHHPRILISSNGFNTKKILNKTEEILGISRRVGLRLSVDGYEDTHDRIRGVPGGFERCMTTLWGLKNLGVKDLGLSFTISPANLDDLAKIYHLSRHLNVEFTLTVAQNSEFYFKTKNNVFDLDREKLQIQFDELVSNELKAFHPKRWFRAYYDKGVYDYGTGKRVLKNCSAGKDFFFSSARGEIYPCPVLNEKIGDAGNGNFETVWKSEQAKVARNIAKNCSVKCWMTCTVAPYFRHHFISIAWWILRNKLKAHMGLDVL